jgi:hypothetical protein
MQIWKKLRIIQASALKGLSHEIVVAFYALIFVSGLLKYISKYVPLTLDRA